MSDKYPCIATTKQELHLFFANSTQDQALVGHLRGDFGRGKEFWTTWWEKNDELKTDQFKTELDELVNTLCKDGPLTNFDTMSAFCRSHPEARLCLQDGREVWGFRVDTPGHRYYLRCIPHRGDYHFYLLCYQSDLFRDYGTRPREVQTTSNKRKGSVSHER